MDQRSVGSKERWSKRVKGEGAKERNVKERDVWERMERNIWARKEYWNKG